MDVRYLSEPRKGLSNARNAALVNSRGKLIIFTDDDALPSVAWLEHMISALCKVNCHAATGEFVPAAHLLRDWMGPVHRLCMADSSVAKPRNGVQELFGGNMGFHRSVLDHVHGFDPELGAGALGFAEETLFGWQLAEAGFKVAYVEQAKIVHDFDPLRLLRHQWLSAAKKRGQTDAYVLHHWEHGIIRFAFLKWLYNMTKLYLRRIVQRPCRLDEEGCQLWEMSYVQKSE